MAILNLTLAALTACSILAAFSGATSAEGLSMTWTQLPPIPDPEGFASPFAGVSNGVLIVGGGANIPIDKWADPFRKVWYDSACVLDKPDGKWQTGFKLPRPLGYGVSISYGDSLICIGGSDANRHYADVFRLAWKNNSIETSTMPPLPKTCANASGALVGNTIYIAGGIETPTATSALKTFWKLDLTGKEPRWTELEPCPGPARMLAVAGSLDGSFYLFSGTALKAGADGKPVRECLHDAYRFTPGKSWERLADMPRAAVAAPSPTPCIHGKLMVISGDDGLNLDFKPLNQHPGFPKEALSFDPHKNQWSAAGTVPFSRATAPVIEWRGRILVINGEARPRERSPLVWSTESAK